jgi:hypothetical protein
MTNEGLGLACSPGCEHGEMTNPSLEAWNEPTQTEQGATNGGSRATSRGQQRERSEHRDRQPLIQTRTPTLLAEWHAVGKCTKEGS